ncbi:hypothetical protein BD770DRAFT_412644 [Pilaira anomala]|nr:hypothetical protein BD770DRAFT_412644 [Pilaira anomala]
MMHFSHKSEVVIIWLSGTTLRTDDFKMSISTYVSKLMFKAQDNYPRCHQDLCNCDTQTHDLEMNHASFSLHILTNMTHAESTLQSYLANSRKKKDCEINAQNCSVKYIAPVKDTIQKITNRIKDTGTPIPNTTFRLT